LATNLGSARWLVGWLATNQGPRREAGGAIVRLDLRLLKKCTGGHGRLMRGNAEGSGYLQREEAETTAGPRWSLQVARGVRDNARGFKFC